MISKATMTDLDNSDETPETLAQTGTNLTEVQHQRLMLAIERLGLRSKTKRETHYRGCSLPDGTSIDAVITFVATEVANEFKIVSTHLPISSFFNKEANAATLTNVVSIFKMACHWVPGFDAISQREPLCVKRTQLALPTPPAPIPFDGTEPKLVFGSKLLGYTSIAPSSLKNVLNMGETGAGKTASGVFPMQDALLSYQLHCGRKASVLLIDPKLELLARARKLLKELGQSERLKVVGECPPIRYFSDDDGLSLSDRYAAVSSFLSFNNDVGDGARWQKKADQLARELLGLDQEFLDATGMPLLESVLTLTKLTDHMQIGQWAALMEFFRVGMSSEAELRLMADAMEVLWVTSGLAVKPLPLNRYVTSEHGSEQFFYLARLGMLVAETPGSPQIRSLIDFDMRLGLHKPQTISVKEIVNGGGVLVFQPASSAAHDVVGKAVKTLFLSAVLGRADMLRPIGYISDEAHRWITADRITGEQNFLDRCRAYRVVTVLATQSIPSILGAMDNRFDKASALASILANTPTKMMFRNTDPVTVSQLKTFIPGPPAAGIHILDARPPSTLQTGEYYYQLGNEWGRARYQPGPATGQGN